MIGFVQKVRRTIRSRQLLEPGQRVAVGVSGGPDSVALTRALTALRYPLVLVYVDHQTRPETRTEAAFVSTLATEVGADFVGLTAEPRSSSEEALRNARYAAFEAFHSGPDAGDRFALGHTASDQAETVLMRMIRGSGTVGLAGIPARRGPFIRPLLDRSFDEVVFYLSEIKQEYCVDPTNASLDPVRNRVRHQLMPMLRDDFHPTVERSLCRLADASRRDRTFIEDAAATVVRTHARDGFIAVAALREAHPDLLPHILRQLCPEPQSAERLAALEELIARGRGEVQLEGAVDAFIRRSGEFGFRPKDRSNGPSMR